MLGCNLCRDDHHPLGRVKRKGTQQRRERLGNTEMGRGVRQRRGWQAQQREQQIQQGRGCRLCMRGHRFHGEMRLNVQLLLLYNISLEKRTQSGARTDPGFDDPLKMVWRQVTPLRCFVEPKGNGVSRWLVLRGHG